MKKFGFIPLLGIGLMLWSCSTTNKEAILKKNVEDYFIAWNKHDFHNPDYSNFKRDTSYTWHGEKKDKGNQSIFDPNSGWGQWDIAWNGIYTFDIIKVDIDSMTVSGKFNETTDFLKFIGMPEGFDATVTYWFGDDYRVKETLYAWNPNNKSMGEVIKPIVEWATLNDSIRIHKIYLNDGFVPGTANAEEWKILFRAYNLARQENKSATSNN